MMRILILLVVTVVASGCIGADSGVMISEKDYVNAHKNRFSTVHPNLQGKAPATLSPGDPYFAAYVQEALRVFYYIDKTSKAIYTDAWDSLNASEHVRLEHHAADPIPLPQMDDQRVFSAAYLVLVSSDSGVPGNSIYFCTEQSCGARSSSHSLIGLRSIEPT